LQRAYTELFDRFASFAMLEPVYLQAAQLRGVPSPPTPSVCHFDEVQAVARRHRNDRARADPAIK
jgi:hypothetical protein